MSAESNYYLRVESLTLEGLARQQEDLRTRLARLRLEEQERASPQASTRHHEQDRQQQQERPESRPQPEEDAWNESKIYILIPDDPSCKIAENDETACPICYTNEATTIGFTECIHRFCAVCIRRRVLLADFEGVDVVACPMCRQGDVTLEAVEDVYRILKRLQESVEHGSDDVSVDGSDDVLHLQPGDASDEYEGLEEPDLLALCDLVSDDESVSGLGAYGQGTGPEMSDISLDNPFSEGGLGTCGNCQEYEAACIGHTRCGHRLCMLCIRRNLLRVLLGNSEAAHCPVCGHSGTAEALCNTAILLGIHNDSEIYVDSDEEYLNDMSVFDEADFAVAIDEIDIDESLGIRNVLQAHVGGINADLSLRRRRGGRE